MTHKTLAFSFFVACLALGGVAIVYSSTAESRLCTKLGGHLVSRPNTNVGVNPQGEVVMTSAEGKVCVNAAGHVLQ